MIRRITLWGAVAVAIVLAAQLLLREPTPASTQTAPVAVVPREPTLSRESPRAALASEEVAARDERADEEPRVVAEAADVPRGATAAPDNSRRFVFDCGNGVMFSVRTMGRQATLFSPQALGAEVITLPQVEAEPGTRYSQGGVSFSPRGGLATFEIRDRLYADCTSNPGAAQTAEALRRGTIFRARGNEPSWLLEISRERIELATDLGTRRIEFPYREPAVAGSRTTYRTFLGSQEFGVLIDAVPCNDTMSGERFEATVTVTFENRTFYGCGQAP